MSVGFGFSIGDIIAVSKLAVGIADALDDSRGAVADYKSLSELLRSLTHSLHTVSGIFFYTSSNTSGSVETALLNGLHHGVECCKRLMDEFLTTSKKYTESLLNGQGSRVKREWRKIKWSLYKTEDVQELKTNLQVHVEAFQMYIFAINWYDIPSCFKITTPELPAPI